MPACGGGAQMQVRGARFDLSGHEARLARIYEQQDPADAPDERCKYWTNVLGYAAGGHKIGIVIWPAEYFETLRAWVAAKRDEACVGEANRLAVDAKPTELDCMGSTLPAPAGCFAKPEPRSFVTLEEGADDEDTPARAHNPCAPARAAGRPTVACPKLDDAEGSSCTPASQCCKVCNKGQACGTPASAAPTRAMSAGGAHATRPKSVRR